MVNASLQHWQLGDQITGGMGRDRVVAGVEMYCF